MPERCVDLWQVAHVDENEREWDARIRLQYAVEMNLRSGPVGQSGERVVICEVGDAILAVRDARLHGVERRGELAEVLRAAHVHGAVVATLLNAARCVHWNAGVAPRYFLSGEDLEDVTIAGKGVIDGVECDHLAFRNVETDWQIWIESGAKPIPRKYVITSKGIGEAPQYTLRIKEWKTDVAADAFAFKADPSFKKIALGDLSDIDEVPQGTTKTGDKK